MNWLNLICALLAYENVKCAEPEIAPPPCKGAIERCQQDVRPTPPRDCDQFNSRVPCRLKRRWRSYR